MSDKINIVMSLSGDDEGALSLLKQVESRMAELEKATKQAGKNISQSMADATKSTKDLASGASSAGKTVSDSLNQIKASGKQVTDQLRLARDAFMAFAGVKFLAGQVKNIMDMADAYGQMTSRIKIVTKETGNYNEVTKELQRISQLTYKQFTDNAEIFVRTEKTMREMGFATNETMGVVEALSTSLVVSSANTQMTDGAINTLSKSLQLGKINLKDFQTLTANSPRLLQALADGLGVTGQELQKMARAGQLTSDKVVPALITQLDRLREETEAMPVSFSDAATKFGNAMLFWVGQTDEAIGASKMLTSALGVLSDNIGAVMAVLTALATLITATLVRIAIPYLITAFKALGATAVASAGLAKAAWESVTVTLARVRAAALAANASLLLIGKAIAVLAAAWAGWQIGTWANQFEFVRKAGIAMVQALVYAFEYLKYKWEQVKAVFTDDTLAQVHDRWKSRLTELGAIFDDMYSDATAEAEEAAAAAEQAAKNIEVARNALIQSAMVGAGVLDAAIKEVDSALKDVEKRYSEAGKQITSSLSDISSAYSGLSGIAEQEMMSEMDALEQRYALELAEIERVTTSKDQMLRKSSALLSELLQTEVALRQQNTEAMMALIDEEGRKRIEAAARMAQTEEERHIAVQKVENEILETKRQTLEKQVADYQKHIETLNKEEQKHLDAIVAIEEKKRQARMSGDEKLRELQRKLMTDYEVYQDKQTEIADLQAKAREALSKGEYDTAVEYAKKMESVAMSTASAVKEGDQDIVKSHEAVAKASENVKTANDLIAQAYTAQQNAHDNSAKSAVSARKDIEQALSATQSQVKTLASELEHGLNVSISMNTDSFDEGVAKVEAALNEKERLMPIKVDLEEAKRDIEQMQKDLENGMTVTVDLTKAKEALAELGEYASEEGRVELQVATTEAESAIGVIETKIKALSSIETQSKHQINSNVDKVKANIDSLNNRNTSSTHTIYERRVAAKNAGGLITAQHLNTGGVAGFPALRGGVVPGVGNTDTVPRTLDAGAFVLRKAAVQKYRAALSGVMNFAGGGRVKKSERTEEEKEVYKMLSNLNSYGKGLPPVQTGSTSMSDWAWKLRDRFWMMKPDARKQVVDEVLKSYEGWMRNLNIAHKMRHPVAMSMQMLSYLAMNKGGNAKTGTDTVPAMLTPGEWVVPRNVVQRLGVGFFSALNSLKAPMGILGQHVQRFAQGGMVLATNSPMPARVPLSQPEPSRYASTKTIALDLNVSGTKIKATMPESEESKLLTALARAKANAS